MFVVIEEDTTIGPVDEAGEGSAKANGGSVAAGLTLALTVVLTPSLLGTGGGDDFGIIKEEST